MLRFNPEENVGMKQRKNRKEGGVLSYRLPPLASLILSRESACELFSLATLTKWGGEMQSENASFPSPSLSISFVSRILFLDFCTCSYCMITIPPSSHITRGGMENMKEWRVGKREFEKPLLILQSPFHSVNACLSLSLPLSLHNYITI